MDREMHPEPPEGALVLEGRRQGWHWVRLSTAEDLAREIGLRFPHFDLQRVARTGGVPAEGEEGGFAVLRQPDHSAVLMGIWLCDAMQFPTHVREGVPAEFIRGEYADALDFLGRHAQEFFGHEGKAGPAMAP